MRFTETPLAGAWLMDLDPHLDERGSFARIFCDRTFADRGLTAHWPQINLSHNPHRGTVRGLHFQAAPHEEAKVVRCVRGAIFDVLVDLRPGSPTRHRWFGATLDAEQGKALYIPPGCAHGFQVLEPDSEVLYFMSAPYEPAAARGLRWNDPTLAIAWPLPDEARLGPRDAALPFLSELAP